MGVRTGQVPAKGRAAGAPLACFRVIHTMSRKTVWGVRIFYLNLSPKGKEVREKGVVIVFSF